MTNEEELPLATELLEKEIGYTFKDKSILNAALTHSSYSNESKHKDVKIRNNERLEFLGDSVLSVIVSDYLFHNYDAFDEGDLTRTRAAVVCENTLSELSTQLRLGDYMFLGHGEILTHGRHRKSIIADAFEALLAAIYLDGGMSAAKEFLLKRLLPFISRNAYPQNDDYKSKLQKITQQTPEENIEYILVSEEGPPHNKTFYFKVMLNSNCLGQGSGRTKREAEQNAAKEALTYFGVDTESES